MREARNNPRLVALLVALSWFGLVVHNFIERVDGSTAYMAVVGAMVYAVWWLVPARWLGDWILVLLAAVHLLGAIVTIIPLAILPFVPEQSATHYASHVVYGSAQLPLVWVIVRRRLAQKSPSL